MPNPAVGSLLIRDVRLYRDVRRSLEPAIDLLLLDGRVAPPGKTAPDDVAILEGRGRTALPGLIDAHMHLPHRAPHATLLGYLRDGVTCVRSMGNSWDELAAARGPSDGDGLPRPRVLATGPMLTAPGGHPMETIYTDRPEQADTALSVTCADEVEAAVARLVEQGADAVKVLLEDGRVFGKVVPKLSPELVAAAVTHAHAAGLPVVAHCGGAPDYETALQTGVDEVEHVSADFAKPWVPRDIGRRLARAGRVWTPTLYITEAVTKQLSSVAFPLAWRYLGAAFRRYLVAFQEAGGILVAGTDSADTYESYAGAVPREVELLADMLSLPPSAALATATTNAAHALRRPDLGHLRPGAAGDVALFDGDPTRDLRHLRFPSATVVAGRVAWEA